MKLIKERLHQLFIVTIFLKGLYGILEIFGGLILLFVKSNSIIQIVRIIFHHELLEDPHDLIANFFILISQNATVNSVEFSAIYLICYGCIDLGLFLGLWKKKAWIYPLFGTIMVFLILYQIFRIITNYSFILFLLTILDIFILLLLKPEYVRLKHSLKQQT